MVLLASDPFDLSFNLHVIGGFWPLRTSVQWKRILFSVFSFLSHFSLTSMIFIQIVDIYLLRNQPVRLTQDLCSFASSSSIVMKILFLFYKVDSIIALKDKFTAYKSSLTDPVHLHIIRQSDRSTMSILRTFHIITIACALFWMLYPGLDSQEQRRLPLPYKVPVEERTFGMWVGLYVYQSLAIVSYLLGLLGVDGIFCGFVLRIGGHYDIIIANLRKLEGLGRSEEERKVVKRILRESVELHKDILRDVKLLESIYSPAFLVHATAVIVIVVTAITDLPRIGRNFSIQILQKLLYVLGGVWDTFLYCYCASKMHEKSLALSAAVYSTPWYRFHPDIRKDLTFISSKAQKMAKIKVAHLFYLDLKAFVMVLRISYDITALLFRVVKE